MTTANLYDTWHHAGDWVLTYWPWLGTAGVILAAAVAVGWMVGRDDYRSHNDRRAAWLTVCNGPRPEPAAPGTDEQLLAACLQIMRATDKAAKGDPQP